MFYDKGFYTQDFIWYTISTRMLQGKKQIKKQFRSWEQTDLNPEYISGSIRQQYDILAQWHLYEVSARKGDAWVQQFKDSLKVAGVQGPGKYNCFRSWLSCCQLLCCSGETAFYPILPSALLQEPRTLKLGSSFFNFPILTLILYDFVQKVT